jgi:hypothetical protein
MMLEHMNQVVKHSALRNNFRNTLLTSSTRLAEKIAFDIYCGAHAGSNQVELEVSCVEECSQGTSPTIDHLIRLGVLRLATPDGTLEVKWLRKAKLSKSAFTPGDYVQTSTGHVALLMDLFQVNGDNNLSAMSSRTRSTLEGRALGLTLTQKSLVKGRC